MELPHHCSACGEIHGGSAADSEAVRIAKINADRDIEVARLARSEARQEIEAQVEQTEIEAAAEVDAAVVAAGLLEEIVTPPETPAEPEPELEPQEAPVIVAEPEPDGDEVPAPPETGSGKPRAVNDGFWAGYSTS